MSEEVFPPTSLGRKRWIRGKLEYERPRNAESEQSLALQCIPTTWKSVIGADAQRKINILMFVYIHNMRIYICTYLYLLLLYSIYIEYTFIYIYNICVCAVTCILRHMLCSSPLESFKNSRAILGLNNPSGTIWYCMFMPFMPYAP